MAQRSVREHVAVVVLVGVVIDAARVQQRGKRSDVVLGAIFAFVLIAAGRVSQVVNERLRSR